MFFCLALLKNAFVCCHYQSWIPQRYHKRWIRVKWIASLIRSSSRLLPVVARSYTGPTQAIKFTPLCVCVFSLLLGNLLWCAELYYRQGFRCIYFFQLCKLLLRWSNSRVGPPFPFTLQRLNCWCPVKCCDSALLLLPALCQRPGCLVVFTLASKQLKIGHCLRLSAKSIRIPYSDQFVKAPLCSRGPQGVCVFLSLVSIPISLCSVWSFKLSNIWSNSDNCLLSLLTSAWRKLDRSNGKCWF